MAGCDNMRIKCENVNLVDVALTKAEITSPAPYVVVNGAEVFMGRVEIRHSCFSSDDFFFRVLQIMFCIFKKGFLKVC